VGRRISVMLALVGAAAGTSAAAVIMDTGCTSSATGHSGSDTTKEPMDSGTGGRDVTSVAPGSSTDATPTGDASTASPQADGANTEDDAGDGSLTDGMSPDCDANSESGSCAHMCPDAGVGCTVQFATFSCELAEFADASAIVTCGQTATVGTACCGGCGCVAVEVYYDGRQCWEGIPDCPDSAVAGFAGRWFDPHAPHAP
jgi:hypothetical protein